MNTDDRKWEIIESEYLIRRPWLTARRDRVKLPTGVEIPEYYILEYPVTGFSSLNGIFRFFHSLAIVRSTPFTKGFRL